MHTFRAYKKNMKRKIYAGIVALMGVSILAAFAWSKEEKAGILEIGAEAPMLNYEVRDVSGKLVTLDDAAGENGLLVIFSCNTCPFVIGNGTKSEGWEGRYPEMVDLAEKHGMGTILLNPNEAKRDAGDGMGDMKKRYDEKNLKGFYALDENHKLADAFGALTTPHIFLFDKDMKLIYKGAIDDSVSSSEDVKEPYLKNAIKAYANGEKIDPNSTKQLGCSIKRVKV